METMKNSMDTKDTKENKLNTISVRPGRKKARLQDTEKQNKRIKILMQHAKARMQIPEQSNSF